MINSKNTKENIKTKNPSFYFLLKSKGNINRYRVNKRIYNYLNDSDWIDKDFYNKNYPSIKKSGLDPLVHYILYGYKEGKFPSGKFKQIYNALKDFRWFDKKYYLKDSPNIKRSGVDPLVHYILFGYDEGKFPSITFEKIYNTVKDSGLFDEKFYLKNYPNIKKSGLHPLLDYIFFGFEDGRIPSDNFERIYDILKDSGLFDELYYTKKYPAVNKSGIDPLLHYMFFGHIERNFPSFKFDGNYYLDTHKDVRERDYNPLVHYLLYGRDEGKVIKSNIENHKFADYTPNDVNNILEAFNRENIVIVLYINNDFEETEKTVTSILENTRNNYELILIDDACTDNSVKTLLNRLDTIENIRIIRNHHSLGFIKSINNTIKNSNGDVLLINPSTVVTDHWLQKMVVAAYSDEKIGTVMPFSNSVKFLCDIISKTTNLELKPNEIAALVENVSEHLKPEISYPDDSCLYIKRKAINDVGLFNEDINEFKEAIKDFYRKVFDNGLKNIIDDATYVYHDNESIDEEWNHDLELSPLIDRIKRIIGIRARYLEFTVPKKRLLIILHENIIGLTGGTGQTTKDILEEIDESLECFILTPAGNSLKLWKRDQNQIIAIKAWTTESKWSATEFYNEEYKDIYFKILVGLNIDILHIQHMIRHTNDLHEVANSLGIPIILSFHDFYYICPSINLLDHNNCYCAGQCSQQKMQCKIPTNIYDELPILSEFNDTWKKECSKLIDVCTTVTAPTRSTMDLYTSIYPQLKHMKSIVIENGRDFDIKRVDVEIPSKSKPIKIIVPGIIKHHKGHQFIKDLKKIDTDNRIEFHFMGIIPDDLEEIGIYHGRYVNEEFCEIVGKIKPSFIGIFSICPETYCHVLTEAWSCGVPVLATKMGALEERIVENGGGWFLEHKSPINAYNKILEIADSPEEYLKVIEDVSNIKIKGRKEMADDYERIYNQNLVINKRRINEIS